MKNRNTITRIASISLVLLLALGNLRPVALADVSQTVKDLGEIVKLWEGQAAKGNKPGQGDCNYMRAQLANAQAELAAERADWQNAKNNPPKKENAQRSITPGWAKHMSDWQKELNDAEKQLKELAKRIDKLCPPPVAAVVEKQVVAGTAGESSATLSGVVTVALDTAKGQVKLTVPADIRAGDTISGTVDDESLARAGDVLNGAVYEIGGQQYQLRNRILAFAVPAGLGTSLAVVLKDRTGHG